MNLEAKLHEVVTVGDGSPEDRTVSFYVRAARYRRLLYFIADRVLGDPDKAAIAVDNCLYSAAQVVTAFDCEGAFRSWLVRLAIDEALAILHGQTASRHRQVYSTPVANQGDFVGYLTGVSTELVESSPSCEEKHSRIEDNATQ